MDYQFIVFVILAIIISTYVPMIFYKQNKNIGAFLSLLMLILIFTFYGLRWFKGSALTGPAGAYSGTWPPYVNVCPDYLTYYESGNTKGCINKTTQQVGDLPIAGQTPSDDQIFKYDLSNKKTACEKAREKRLTWEGITNGDSCTF